MIVKTQKMELDGFIIPSFSLEAEKMIRLWVQVVPQQTEDSDGYLMAKKYQNLLVSEKRNPNIKIIECLNISKIKTKESFLILFKRKTAYEYLKNKFNLSDKAIKEKMDFFEIKSHYKLSLLGFAHQKLFSIVCEFQKHQNIIFDYYGLGPKTEKQLSQYVKTELINGKSAIAFDNLNFKPEILDNEKITNINILRKKSNLF